MRTCTLFTFIALVIAAPTYGDLTLPGGWISTGLPYPIRPVSPSATPTVGVIRLIHVTVSPTAPTSSDQVSVTISLQASSAYLVLDRTTVDKQGSNIAIDLYWSDHPPVVYPLLGVQACSLGYGIEQVSPTPSGVQANNTYETTQPLGTFSPGTYQISLHTHGAIEGEASAMFQVRDPVTTPSSTFNFGSVSQPTDSTDSIWNRLHALTLSPL